MNKYRILILLIFFNFFVSTVTAKTIHSILVTDNIHDISFITQADLRILQAELRTISKHTGSILKEKTFCGSEFRKDQVIHYLKNLTVESTDSIVFYFSGHGYRTKDKKTPWPYLSFELYKIGLDQQWIADTIWKKKPQFALILADCCNNFAEKGIQRETKHIQINLHRKAPQYSGYKQLFVNAKGCVVVCSSSEGQFSYGSQLGGVFTQCFLASLNKEIAEPKPSWKNLLERTCSYIKQVQKPICKIYK